MSLFSKNFTASSKVQQKDQFETSKKSETACFLGFDLDTIPVNTPIFDSVDSKYKTICSTTRESIMFTLVYGLLT